MDVLHTDPITIQITRDELLAMANALGNVLGGPYSIEEWEFGALMGVKPDEATALQRALGGLLDATEPPQT